MWAVISELEVNCRHLQGHWNAAALQKRKLVELIKKFWRRHNEMLKMTHIGKTRWSAAWTDKTMSETPSLVQQAEVIAQNLSSAIKNWLQKQLNCCRMGSLHWFNPNKVLDYVQKQTESNGNICISQLCLVETETEM